MKESREAYLLRLKQTALRLPKTFLEKSIKELQSKEGEGFEELLFASLNLQGFLQFPPRAAFCLPPPHTAQHAATCPTFYQARKF